MWTILAHFLCLLIWIFTDVRMVSHYRIWSYLQTALAKNLTQEWQLFLAQEFLQHPNHSSRRTGYYHFCRSGTFGLFYCAFWTGFSRVFEWSPISDLWLSSNGFSKKMNRRMSTFFRTKVPSTSQSHPSHNEIPPFLQKSYILTLFLCLLSWISLIFERSPIIWFMAVFKRP